jgi:hypothetical protein
VLFQVGFGYVAFSSISEALRGTVVRWARFFTPAPTAE